MTDLTYLAVDELLSLHAAVLGELKARGITSTRNSPTGDYAEWLFCTAFGLSRRPNSAAGYDAVDDHGKRYQIKARSRKPEQSVWRPLSFMRGLEDAEAPFDVLAAAIFGPTYEIEVAFLLPFEAVLERARFVPHVNAWRLRVSPPLLADPRTGNVTMELREAAKNQQPMGGDHGDQPAPH